MCELNLNSKEDAKAWLLRNHPDKKKNSPVDIGLFTDVMNCYKERDFCVGGNPPEPPVTGESETDLRSSSAPERGVRGVSPLNKKKRDKIYTCMRQTENWSKILPEHKLDKKTFKPELVKEAIHNASPKLEQLFRIIEQVDANDLQTHGHYFKHFIFSDVKEEGYGAKILASAFIANGYKNLITPRVIPGQKALKLSLLPTGADGKDKAFGLLSSSPLFNSEFNQKFKKEILTMYNKRPDNIHGTNMRFIILDSGFKEGIDLFDVKYVHIFEPSMTVADLKQTIGRATRTCGQKGLNFEPNVGWPLFVYNYYIAVPEEIKEIYEAADPSLLEYPEEDKKIFANATKMKDATILYSGFDRTMTNLAEQLYKLAPILSVDFELTKNIHRIDDMTYLYEQQQASVSSAERSADEETQRTSVGSPAVGGSPAVVGGANKVNCKGKCGLRSTKDIPATVNFLYKVYVKYGHNKKNVPAKHPRAYLCDYMKRVPVYCEQVNKEWANRAAFVPFLLNKRMKKGTTLKGTTLKGKTMKKKGTYMELSPASATSYMDIGNSTKGTTIKGRTKKGTYMELNPKNATPYMDVGTPAASLAASSSASLAASSSASLAASLAASPAAASRAASLASASFAPASLASASLAPASYLDINPDGSPRYLDIKPQKAPSYLDIEPERSATPYMEIGTTGSKRSSSKHSSSKRSSSKRSSSKRSSSKRSSSKRSSSTLQMANEVMQQLELVPYVAPTAEIDYAIVEYKGKPDSQMKQEKAGPPTKKLSFEKMRDFIKTNYVKNFTWGEIVVENKCVAQAQPAQAQPAQAKPAQAQPAQAQPAQAQSQAKVGGASRIMSLNPTQDFVRTFFTPESPYKGLLLFHSVGTGKTCSAIATATSSFEQAGYTILWVTRTTLKSDVYKNMFDDVCHIILAERIKKGLAMPEDLTRRKKLLSKNWIEPISYKTFSNLLTPGAHNEYMDKLIQRNGTADILRKTLIIIDEAHKLYGGDLKAGERPDMDVMERLLQKSYEKSGKDSAKLLIMTATPFTNSPMELFKLINLCKETKSEHIETDIKAFRRNYMNSDLLLTDSGVKKLADKMSGYISYLNREQDPTQFAQPVMIEVPVIMSHLPDNEVRKELFAKDEKKVNVLNKLEAKALLKQQETAIKDLNKRLRETHKRLKVMVKERQAHCKTLKNKVEKANCMEESKNAVEAEINETVSIIRTELERLKESEKQNKGLKEAEKARVAKMKERLETLRKELLQEVMLAERCKSITLAYE